LKKKDYKFIVGGSGPAFLHYRRLAQKAGVADIMKFPGFIEMAEVQEYYAAADLFCIPSTFETQGMVALEAMATGKPVVGADKLALSELIKNGKNGEKFAAGDWKGCARKIEKVINNIDSYNDMLTTAKSFSLENVTTDLLGLYKSLIGNRTA
jgi:1,2-diacylglycerol 3-alpha-glucosyltransferase